MRRPAESLLGVLALLASHQAAAANQNELRERVSVTQRLGANVPLSVPLVSERGQRLPLAVYLHGRPAVIALVYFQCPNLCTLTLNSLADSLKHLRPAAGRDYSVLAISIDPREGPKLATARHATFANSSGVSCRGCTLGWQFLTAGPQDIRKVTDALGYRYFWDAGQSQYAHPAGIVVVSAGGRIVQYFGGLEFPPSELERALDRAAAGQTGSLAERLWLLCFHYAALTGKYSGRISVLLRILGLTTVAALGSLMLLLSRHARE